MKIRSRPMIRNVLWDVDGILFDTYPAITHALSLSLNELGMSVPLNVIDGLARQSLDHSVEGLAQRVGLDPALLNSRFAASYAAIPLANQPPLPGVDEVCHFIHEHGGLNIVITHRGVGSTQGLLDVHELARWFAGILSVEQGYPAKPNPAMVLAALCHHALDPAETLLLGNRDLDMQAGRSAGISTCLVGRAPLSQPTDFQVDSCRQLLTLLRGAQWHTHALPALAA